MYQFFTFENNKIAEELCDKTISVVAYVFCTHNRRYDMEYTMTVNLSAKQ